MREPVTKITIRLYTEDYEILKAHFPGEIYGEPGISETIREIIHKWVDKNREALEAVNDKPDSIGVEL